MHQNKISLRSAFFANKQINSQFELNGFVVLPLLNAEEIKYLNEAYNSNLFNNPEGFYSSSFSINESVKLKLNSGIDAIVGPKVNQHFNSFKTLGCCYLSKAPGAIGQMPIHQDWTVVDETKFDSVTIWIPLQDVDEFNGAMQVIPGSHRFSDALRSPLFDNPLSEIENEIRKDLQLITLKAGEALIFSQSLIHASPANQSNTNRLAVTFGLIPETADLLFYYKNPETFQAEKYLVPKNFFENYNTKIGQKPIDGILIKEFNYSQIKITPDEYRLKKHIYQLKTNKKINMKQIFKDKVNQDFFEKEGYLILPTLDKQEIESLTLYYESLHLNDEKGFGFHVSMDQSDKGLCAEIQTNIWKTVLPKLDEYVENYKPFVASYVIKESNPKGMVPAHQDWTFVDKENEGFGSITCWTALVDMTLDNGCMGVIKGSNKLMQNFRPSPSPQTPVPLSDHMFSIFPYLKTLEMKAGETLFFDNRTFHASPPNTTNEIRLAVGVGITQKDAELVHYFLKPDGNKNTILKYKVDENFFLKYDNARLSKMYDNGEVITDYEVVEEIPYFYNQYTSDDLTTLIKQAGNEYNVPMCEKLAVLFNYDITGVKKEESILEEKIEEKNIVEDSIQEEWIDNRTFFEKYTPMNILREIKFRITGK
jgi:ectoine hydroxylase-related dioxygenase (phytanoyl-CoA dioxygenase family)